MNEETIVCHCGCGQSTPKYSKYRKGIIKQFISGHNLRKIDRKDPIRCSKISKSRINEKNPMWKGDKVGYNPLHNWVRRHKPKPKLCERCKKDPPSDLANISQKYKRDVTDYEWLCRRCHMTEDGRINQLKNRSRDTEGKYI